MFERGLSGQREDDGILQSPRELEGELAKRFQFVGVLGQGTFGKVSAVIDKQKKTKSALKKIKMGRKQQGLPASVLREVVLLKCVSHPNIVKYTNDYKE